MRVFSLLFVASVICCSGLTIDCAAMSIRRTRSKGQNSDDDFAYDHIWVSKETLLELNTPSSSVHILETTAKHGEESTRVIKARLADGDGQKLPNVYYVRSNLPETFRVTALQWQKLSDKRETIRVNASESQPFNDGDVQLLYAYLNIADGEQTVQELIATVLAEDNNFKFSVPNYQQSNAVPPTSEAAQPFSRSPTLLEQAINEIMFRHKQGERFSFIQEVY